MAMARDETGKMPIPPSVAVHITCCVCLNKGVRRTALVRVGAKYQGCAEHRDMVDAPDFDPMTLLPKRPGRV